MRFVKYCIVVVKVVFLLFTFQYPECSQLPILYMFVYLFDSTEEEERGESTQSTQYSVSYYTGMLLENWRDSSNLTLTNIVLSRALI